MENNVLKSMQMIVVDWEKEESQGHKEENIIFL
jgi:hypothetical protein